MPFLSPFGAFLAPVRSGWGEDRSYRGAGSIHEGIDLLVPVGTPVKAIAAGVVDLAYNDPCNFAGKHVGVAHADGWRSVYMHFSRVDVQRGQQVAAGQQLGLSGRTGGSTRGPGCTFDPDTASHVHLSLMRAAPLAGAIHGSERSGYVNVPAEPHVPADYQRTLVDRLARQFGIAPTTVVAVAAGGGILALLAGLAAGWWWLKRKTRRT